MIDQKIIDDFLRTKEDFIEQFATRFINNLFLALDEKQKQLDKKREESYVVEKAERASIDICFVGYNLGFMNPGKSGWISGSDEWHETLCEMQSFLLDYNFEGESLPEIIKTIYKFNSDNDRGAYFEPLMEIIARSEKNPFVPKHKSLDIETIRLKKPSMAPFFGHSGEAVCKIKPAPLIKDFILAVEKRIQYLGNKFELIQHTHDSYSRRSVNCAPLYNEFRVYIPSRFADKANVIHWSLFEAYTGEKIEIYISASLSN